MKPLITTLLGLALRVALLLLGLVFFASVVLAAILLLILWVARALWCKLTGRAVAPWTFHVRSRANWNRFYSSSAAWSRASRGAGHSPQGGEVIDVQAREAGPDAGPPPALR